MRPQPPLSPWTRIKRAALGFDAWLNSFLFQSGHGLSQAWETYSEKAKCLRFRGVPRVILDLTSEATTLGLLGGVVMLDDADWPSVATFGYSPGCVPEPLDGSS